MNEYKDIDEVIKKSFLEYEYTHPVCHECGANMYEERETYNLDSHVYIDRWYECPKCGHCTKI